MQENIHWRVWPAVLHTEKGTPERMREGNITRALRVKATQENLKSAISDHCKRENHLMNWDAARVIQTESNRYHRWIKEAVEIRKRAPNTMNRDEGA